MRPRTELFGCIARVRNALAQATHEFFHRNGFLYVHTPIITSSDCEGAGEMFQVTTVLDEDPKKLPLVQGSNLVNFKEDFFGKKTFLTVSGQLDVEN